MISEHELLENGNKQQRCQVVRWVRTFPFSFLSKREYCIGRRMWRSQDGCLYGITKVPLSCSHRSVCRVTAFCHGYALAKPHRYFSCAHVRAALLHV